MLKQDGFGWQFFFHCEVVWNYKSRFEIEIWVKIEERIKLCLKRTQNADQAMNVNLANKEHRFASADWVIPVLDLHWCLKLLAISEWTSLKRD